MGLEGSGRSLILTNYPRIHLERETEKTTKKHKIAGLRVEILNPGPPRYETIMLTTEPGSRRWLPVLFHKSGSTLSFMLYCVATRNEMY
jgi:hypothetical protein